MNLIAGKEGTAGSVDVRFALVINVQPGGIRAGAEMDAEAPRRRTHYHAALKTELTAVVSTFDDISGYRSIRRSVAQGGLHRLLTPPDECEVGLCQSPVLTDKGLVDPEKVHSLFVGQSPFADKGREPEGAHEIGKDLFLFVVTFYVPPSTVESQDDGVPVQIA